MEKAPQEELNILYRSPNIIRVIKSRRLRWAGQIAKMDEGRNFFKISIGTPTGKIPLGRSRHRWNDNIRMDLEEIGINMSNWVDSAQNKDYWGALVNVALSLRSISRGRSQEFSCLHTLTIMEQSWDFLFLKHSSFLYQL